MIQALHASIWYYKQMNRLSSILQLHCLGSREPQVQRSHAINVFFLVSATYTQLHVIKLSYFCTSYIMTNWCRPTCIHKKHSYRRETATPHFRPIFNPPLGLGVKKPPAHFLNQQKKFCSALGVVFWWFFLYMEWVKMQQSGRQSLHRKLLGMTSNTSDFFETGEILWSCWLLW